MSEKVLAEILETGNEQIKSARILLMPPQRRSLPFFQTLTATKKLMVHVRFKKISVGQIS